jgi:hypothetical protein
VFDARPEVFAHNVETVPRIFKRIRPAFRYERSLDVLTQARAAGLITKSNLILGMGEEPEEVVQALQDLHDAGTDIITITQYLRPTPRHLPVARWVKPTSSSSSRRRPSASASSACSPVRLVRSSYRAGRLWAQSMVSKGREIPRTCAPREGDRVRAGGLSARRGGRQSALVTDCTVPSLVEVHEEHVVGGVRVERTRGRRTGRFRRVRRRGSSCSPAAATG